MTRMKDLPGERQDAAGKNAASGVVSYSSLHALSNISSVMPVEHVEVIGQIEYNLSIKRARMAQTDARISTSSSLLAVCAASVSIVFW